ncbi:hypothetical protein EW146_g2598 [Bondarzewia mesenterica]|uniref:BBC1/AIM3 cysteine proteinase-fold domain-containing protein n=1 Tax=Bondarzewia mesenterica TaxID=1095465 RepID=A0A4S4M0M3_9AGAM|nr:hypothetical protein EW146_g2598 [Bondarzewia mesenterica]
MSDPPPARPKPGSLRDRIAAFEQKPATTSPALPLPRPKPGGLSKWQPKPASPPSSPAASSAAREGRMSASDAKASIGQGGSLKDRMAALQGIGAFGAPSPAAAPKPPLEKPKWKPPPQVTVSPPVAEGEGLDAGEDEGDAKAKSPLLSPTNVEGEPVKSPSPGVADEDDKEEKDPEEEERLRRAAIAARMARLGGARVGMAPPMFGRKPEVKKPELTREVEGAVPVEISTVEQVKPKDEATMTKEETIRDPGEDEREAEYKYSTDVPSIHTHDVAISPETDAYVDPIHSPPDVAQGTEPQTSTLSEFTLQSNPATSLSADDASSCVPKSPSMPVPVGPRRVLPPRKKSAKSPSPPPVPELAPILSSELHESPAPKEGVRSVAETLVEAAGGREKEVGAFSENAEADTVKDVPPAEIEPTHSKESVTADTEQYEIAPKADAIEAERSTSPSSDLRPESPDDPEVYVKHKRDIDTEAAEPERPSIVAPVPISAAPVEAPLEAQSVSEGPATEAVDPVAEPAEEEKDEATRRKRIAERVAKMGGFNPFSAPPQRKGSFDSVERDSVPDSEMPTSPILDRDDGLRKNSLAAAQLTPPAPAKKESSPSAHKDVTGTRASVESGNTLEHTQEAEELDDDRDLRKRSASSLSVEDSTVESEREVLEGHKDSDELLSEAQYAVLEEIDRDEQGQDEPATRVKHEAKEDDEANTFEGNIVSDGKYLDRGQGHGERVHDERHLLVLDDESHVGSIDRGAAPVHLTDVHTIQEAAADKDKDQPQPQEDDMAPPRITRPLPSAPPAPALVFSTRPGGTDEAPISPSLTRKRFSVPPPARAVPTPDARIEEEPVSPRVATKRASIPPPVRTAPAMPVEHERVMSPQSIRSIPPPPPPADHNSEGLFSQEPEEMSHTYNDEPQEAVPPPPPRKPSLPIPSPTIPHASAPRATSPSNRRISRESTGSYGGRRTAHDFVPPAPISRVRDASPPPDTEQFGSPHAAAKKVPTPLMFPPEPEREVLDDSDGDPIDPRFHSPIKSPTFPPSAALPPTAHDVAISPQTASPPVVEAIEQQSEVDAEQARRATIAERMARLGGIRFGAPPPPARRLPPASEETHGEESADADSEQFTEARVEDEEEDDETARRQRIAAKLVGMGGMRFGMMPGAGPVSQHPPSIQEEEAVLPPPPSRTAPSRPPQPPPAEPESEPESHGTSDDGVKVEAEESELEEVHYEDAEEEIVEEEEEEEAPPPPPPRTAHRPPVPLSRPPVPPAIKRSSLDVPASPPPPPPPPHRKESYDTVTSSRPPIQATQSDYVMVEQEDEESPPPPPARPTRGLPPRAAPPPPMTEPPESSTTGQWELSSIPTAVLDFGESSVTSDMSASMWSEDSTSYPPVTLTGAPRPPPSSEKPIVPLSQHPHAHAPAPVPTEISPDELRSIWGRVGVQICEAASMLHERSKKTLIGNGSYASFIAAVLAQVPNAQPAPAAGIEYGYLVYAQTGGSVHTRASEIMPGDVIVLEDAKLKGHKGLHAYSIVVGEGTPCLGVVCDFDTKKVKVKALQANQHVGQATVESVSYKLEDLKSGSVKVYRVLEA